MEPGQTATRLLIALILDASIAPAQAPSEGSIEGGVINTSTGQPDRSSCGRCGA